MKVPVSNVRSCPAAALRLPYVNRLAEEKSPYLLQHADNPVHWLPWGEEAFARARAEGKPIFLSVGYSTCHWCHVMAHESFEDNATAEIMNREFVNVKVDREERPDVDRVYMTFVQATTGHGGWPMSVWLTPDLKPFVGGTYFPPEDRYGHPGFKRVLMKIADAWRRDRENIEQQGTRIIEALNEAATSQHGAEEQLSGATLENAYRQIARSYDDEHGGFGTAPKFPRPVTLNFLFRAYARDRDGRMGKEALEMNLRTLRKMAAGGMHDHLGGGFARYSVDQFWHVPHFEKMLYDNGQLAVAYADAFQITREPLFESVTRDILDYVLRDMTAPAGGFYSAEDADSIIEQGKPDHAEGAFYVWTEQQIDDSLGADAPLFKEIYGVEPNGNAPAGADPHGEFTGKNILIQRRVPNEQEEEVLARCRAKLFAIRAKRPRPHLDDKIITAWNGLMISGFARAAQVLDNSSYSAAAGRAVQFIRTNLYNTETKTLVRNYRGGPSAVEGFADDYAFLIQGLLDLYEADFNVEWLRFALELQETQDRLFWDAENGGYFSVTGNDPTILLRMKEDNDGAEPAASSVAALNLLRLAQIRNDSAMRERADKTIAAFSATLTRTPAAMPQLLVALDYSRSKPRQIVIAGERDSAETRELLREVHRHYLPNKVLLLADEFLAERLPELRDMQPVNGRAAAYVCENFTCQAPVTSAADLQALL
jgi:uncharacterized protein